MLTPQELKNRITARQKARERMMKALGGDFYTFPKDKQAIMLCEIQDDLLLQKIQTDKVLEGILKDIQGNIASMAELNRSVLAEDTNEKPFHLKKGET